MNLREALGFLVQLRDLMKVRRAKGAQRDPRYQRISPAEMKAAVSRGGPAAGASEARDILTRLP